MQNVAVKGVSHLGPLLRAGAWPLPRVPQIALRGVRTIAFALASKGLLKNSIP